MNCSHFTTSKFDLPKIKYDEMFQLTTCYVSFSIDLNPCDFKVNSAKHISFEPVNPTKSDKEKWQGATS